MVEHNKPATERVTGTKTTPRLVSAKGPFPNEWAEVNASACKVATAAWCSSRRASPFAATVPLSRSAHQMPDD
jgi:hypothetical protein